MVGTSLSRNLDEKAKIKVIQWVISGSESREHFIGWEKLECVFRKSFRLYNTEEAED